MGQLSAAILEDVYAVPLAATSVQFEPGMTVVLGTPADGTATLIQLLAGSERPRRGKVRVHGADPHTDPRLRACIGAVLAEEPELPLPPTAMLAHALGARGPAAGIAERLGLGQARKASARARRALALELALAIPEPGLLAVFEPLALMSPLDRSRNAAELTKLAERASVICATASIDDARLLGGDVVLLDRGRFVRRPGLPLARNLVPGGQATFQVRAKAVETLCRALVDDPAVSGIALDSEKLPEQARISGDDLESVSLAILRAADTTDSRLLAMELAAPSLDEARGATAALWRAAYERAYYAARPNVPPAQHPSQAPPAQHPSQAPAVQHASQAPPAQHPSQAPPAPARSVPPPSGPPAPAVPPVSQPPAVPPTSQAPLGPLAAAAAAVAQSQPPGQGLPSKPEGEQQDQAPGPILPTEPRGKEGS